MIGGRNALLGAARGSGYGNWTGNYSDVSLLLRGDSAPTTTLVPFDESPTPKTLTVVGNASISTAIAKWNQGSGGSSLALDGNGDYLSVGVSTDFTFGTGNFTIECWIYPTSVSGVNVFLNCRGGSSAKLGPVLYLNGSSLVLDNGAGAVVTASGAISVNNWYHIAGVRNGNAWSLYLDGSSVGSNTDTSSYATNTGLWIGSSFANEHYDGYIDDLRVTKGIARYVEGTGANAGKMVFAGTNNLALPTAQLPANITDDPSYNSVSLLLRGGTPSLVPIDESPTPKTLTVFGNAGISTTTFKYGGSALAFDGTGDCLKAPVNTGFDFPGDFTVEMWFYRISATGRQDLLGNYLDAFSGWGIATGSGSGDVFFYHGNSIPVASGNGAWSANAWNHVAVSRAGSVVRLFVNGTQIAINASYSASISANALFNVGATGTFNNGTAAQLFLNGFIDDLRITKGIARYTKSFLPPPAQLPAI